MLGLVLDGLHEEHMTRHALDAPGNNFPGIASQFAMHFQPFATHVFFMNRSCCDANGNIHVYGRIPSHK